MHKYKKQEFRRILGNTSLEVGMTLERWSSCSLCYGSDFSFVMDETKTLSKKGCQRDRM